MAQAQKPTNKLYSACANAIKGGNHDAFVALCMDEGSMGAFGEATNAPATEATSSGLTRTALDSTSLATVSVADDQVVGVKTSTAAAGATLTGFEIMSNSTVGQGNCMMWCSYNAPQVMESTDVIVNSGKVQFKLGS
jgi:hypothetical protein